MSLEVSFLIPAYNNEATIGSCIQSILRQKTSRSFELVIVDDGSTDATSERVREFLNQHPQVILIRKTNGGEASALNEGLKYCRGKFIALVEADVEIEEEWLEKLLQEFMDMKVAGAGGRLVTPQNSSWIARIAGYEVERKFETKERETQHITSANALYRAEIFKEIGNFNEYLLNAVLDSDFNRRVIEKGYKLIYVKEAIAYHHYKSTFKEYLKRQYAYARYRVYEKRIALYPADWLLALNILISFLATLSLVLIPWNVWVPVLFLLFALVFQIPDACHLWKLKKDSILFLYPLVILLRNFIAVVGYGFGVVNKRLKGY